MERMGKHSSAEFDRVQEETHRKFNQPEVECPLSKRVDGKKHSFQFLGDDPYVKCHYCGQVQDALTGRVITPGRR